MEEVWSWAEHHDGQPYPYDAAAARKFAKEVADACKEYGFDGIALDDEYGSLGDGAPADGSGRGEFLVYPEYSGSQYDFPPGGASAAWKEGGKNVFRFCRYFKEYTADADHPNGLWVSNYEYHYLASLPSKLEVDSDNGSGAGNGVLQEYNVRDVVDASYVAQYGSQVLTSQIGMPRSQYGFLSIAFDAFASVTTPPNMIKSAMQTQLKNNYGVIMYFALRERSNYSSSTYFGSRGDQPETYLSRIAEVLYGDTVVYKDQPDYPKFPVLRNGSTAGTGALYGHTD
jgi:hypothetical protein